MSTVGEIEAAIRALTPAERELLADDLPAIMPELNGDAKWQRLINDERPSPALSALGDESAAKYKATPSVLMPTVCNTVSTLPIWHVALPCSISMMNHKPVPEVMAGHAPGN